MVLEALVFPGRSEKFTSDELIKDTGRKAGNEREIFIYLFIFLIFGWLKPSEMITRNFPKDLCKIIYCNQ